MKTYTVLYAEDVPHYAYAEIEARDRNDAVAKARKIDTAFFTAYDPDWNGAVCRRIVSIDDPDGNTIAQDIPLDDFILHHANSEKRLRLEAAQEMFEALWAQETAERATDASQLDELIARARKLRKTALAKARGCK